MSDAKPHECHDPMCVLPDGGCEPTQFTEDARVGRALREILATGVEVDIWPRHYSPDKYGVMLNGDAVFTAPTLAEALEKAKEAGRTG